VPQRPPQRGGSLKRGELGKGIKHIGGGGIRGSLARFLEDVLFPTLPPYRSDTSINFFFGGKG
jgi:hypothetical protein